MYRLIHPGDRQELALRMLFHPVGEGIFLRACEADSYRGLVAALLDDPGYEGWGVEARLLARLRLADDVVLLAALQGRRLFVSERDAPATVNVSADEAFIRSLDRLGLVSIGPSAAGERSDARR